MGNDRKDGTKTGKVLGLNREERALFVAWQSGRASQSTTHSTHSTH